MQTEIKVCQSANRITIFAKPTKAHPKKMKLMQIQILDGFETVEITAFPAHATQERGNQVAYLFDL